MDERIEKAFETANYMATLSNQRRIILEEFNQRCVFYKNGGTFLITPKLLSFVKMTIELGHDEDVSFIDSNNFPVEIKDVNEFFSEITDRYYSALNDYSAKFTEIKSKRRIKDIVEL